jgi:hypothetical protein
LERSKAEEEEEEKSRFGGRILYQHRRRRLLYPLVWATDLRARRISGYPEFRGGAIRGDMGGAIIEASCLHLP